MYRNLQSVCNNYASVGVRRLLLAPAMEGHAELEFCRGVVSAANTAVCRLTASVEEMQRRVLRRELGVSQREYLARAAKLNTILDRARLEDFTVTK
jgi:hypothetical protein